MRCAVTLRVAIVGMGDSKQHGMPWGIKMRKMDILSVNGCAVGKVCHWDEPWLEVNEWDLEWEVE